MPNVVGASHVSFTVSDLAEALRWFQDVFAAEVMMHEPGQDRGAAVLTLPESDLMIGLVAFAAGSKDDFDPVRTGLDHFAFAVETEADLAAWQSHLDGKNVANSGPIEVPPGAILNFKGPCGIALALFWRR
jgi:glyoxylase I family protein